jgi:non-ribosomal peptide synthetase component F
VSRRWLIIVIATAILVAITYLPAQRGDAEGKEDKPPVITATVTTETTVVSTDPPPVRVPCRWFFGWSSQEHADALNEVIDLVVATTPHGERRLLGVTYYYDDGALRRWSDARQRFEAWVEADCSNATHPDGVVTGDTRWIRVDAPRPDIILGRSTDQAVAAIGFPLPDLNPPDITAVNLGVWLAVEPVGPIVARAELGPLWAETTATLATTTFDPGNGDDPIVCTGFGSPIPDDRLATVEPGPCGYTYGSDTDGREITVTITSTWTIGWELSDGGTGTQPDIIVTTTHPYEVREIQTVGTRG